MKTPAFTPGPWNSNTRIEEPTRGHRVSYVGADSAAGILAQVWKPAGGDDAETIANARLIAAAPDLYAALAGLLEVGSCRCKSFCGGRGAVLPPVDMCECCVCEAARVSRAALAKAGGTPPQ